MENQILHLAEFVSPGHPDRLADAIAEGMVDHAVAQDERALVGVEVAVHTNQVFLDGRIAWRSGQATPTPPVDEIVRDVYRRAGYGSRWSPAPEALVITGDLCRENLSEDEAALRGNSDDQNIVIGYATPDPGVNQLPPAHFVANQLGRRLWSWRNHSNVEFGGERRAVHEILGPDFKLLPQLIETPTASGGSHWSWRRLTLSMQHVPGFYYEHQHRMLYPPVKEICRQLCAESGLVGVENIEPDHLFLNGAGDFHVGGPQGDNGLSGKKLVVDHYGPDVPIGGGALCGKDPHKIDRVGPLRARQLARQIARANGTHTKVRFAWEPGESAPFDIQVLIERDGRWVLPPSLILPPRDWFTVEATFAALNLKEVNWQRVLQNGYFADPGVSWEN